MLLLLILATILTVSSNQEFDEAFYNSLGPGYSYTYLQTPPTEKFYPSRSLLECSLIALNSQSEFFSYNKVNRTCKNYSPKSIMTVSSGQDNNEMSYYRSSEWIKTYAISMGANSLIYDSILKKGHPSTWNVDKCVGSYCPNFFRHPLLDIWNELQIDEVKLVLYKNQSAVVTMVFDGRNTSLESWFTQEKLKSSPWSDLASDATNCFSIVGIDNKRRFYVSHWHEGCPKDLGWLTINEAFLTCDWEKSNYFPKILYSDTTSKIKWEDGYGVADSMAIFIRLRQN
ncbi:uncharacterized protein LOC118768521 [Octopus sinensis]|uniref:Uncharacterized protein LOC118768521 n=1 Tax=Octopus sinensis TaxID=2607531 RepID=A0A7E6FTR5_9MOLL|nr:uncharacterized protein LOC118768521 [Octopus sinensis]